MVAKAALVLFFLPALYGQLTITLEPQPLSWSKRLTGTKDLQLWALYITTADPGTPVITRAGIQGATPISEIVLESDVLERAKAANGLNLAGRTWDAGAPLISQAMSAYGWARGSTPFQWAGAALAGADLLRNLLRGRGPDPAPILARLLPEKIACASGDCGQWFVLTATQPDAQRMVVGVTLNSQAEALERIRLARIAAMGYAWD